MLFTQSGRRSELRLSRTTLCPLSVSLVDVEFKQGKKKISKNIRVIKVEECSDKLKYDGRKKNNFPLSSRYAT